MEKEALSDSELGLVTGGAGGETSPGIERSKCRHCGQTGTLQFDNAEFFINGDGTLSRSVRCICGKRMRYKSDVGGDYAFACDLS